MTHASPVGSRLMSFDLLVVKTCVVSTGRRSWRIHTG